MICFHDMFKIPYHENRKNYAGREKTERRSRNLVESVW
jgi:hypothetical protein